MDPCVWVLLRGGSDGCGIYGGFWKDVAMKYMNWILVPIDFSAESRRALQAADRQAARWGTGLLLVHVKEARQTPQTRLTFHAGSLERWSRFVVHADPRHVAYHTCAGDPAEEILHVAEQYRPRKIVMGRGGTRQRPGPVTRAVAAGYPGLVEVVSPHRDDIFMRADVA